MEGRPGQVMSLESELRFPSKVLKEQPSFKSASSEMEEKREKLRKRMVRRMIGGNLSLFTLQMIKLGDSLLGKHALETRSCDRGRDWKGVGATSQGWVASRK